MNAITKGKLRPELISDPEQVRAWCLLMLGREPRPGEVLELVHVRDELWEVQEAGSDEINRACKARHVTRTHGPAGA